jgi:hypothetical protein
MKLARGEGMNRIKFLNFLVVTGIFFTFPSDLSSEEKVQNISTKTAVIFNTLCAKCHEGECSGRLSFNSDGQAASSHIKRYAEEKNLSKGETKEFFTLLEYMKKECTLWMPDKGQWKPENLLHFALPSQHGYFIPLGILKHGKYRLHLETKEDIRFRIEVISSHFDPLLDRSVISGGKDQRLLFYIDTPVTAFLRIRSRQPLHITVLKIEKEDK